MAKSSRIPISQMKRIKFTKEGMGQFKTEYEKFKNLRPEAVRELSRARELGDLSENGLYHAAKARLRSIDSQLKRLSNQIKLADIVSVKKILVEQDGEKIEYLIVGDYEADPSQNKISSNSPIGSSLLGKKPGETVEIQTPKGKLTLKILEIK